ncbi:uncharacterized protein LOC109539281 isoform X4 [Dendroctonus ponderosae]|uniref:uncharacterized protein LOC109539281 isoform X4 n=1 Tax=Dendroctonus ponderosae TaxID=77166 RepID=UPI002035A20E|nr:uncharacterized protein LOC109539281 isoform X4 [Dendroctonus ponderosae]
MNDSLHTANDTTKKPPKKPKPLKLPTPPPDPWNEPSTCPKTPGKEDNGEEKCKEKRSLSGVTENDREMFEYIESLHKSVYSRSTSTFAPAIITEEAFDHLEKLYKLMEQMLELREQNVKLHRRIRDLEHLNNLEKLSGNPDAVEEEYPDLEKDTVFAETLLDSILQDPKNKDLPKYKHLRTSLLRRPRSVSATDRPFFEQALPGEKDEKDRAENAEKMDKQSKVSKWTKVKAAFKWEKASNVGDSKSQDSGIHVPLNYEIARYLRVPSTGDEMGHSPGDSGAGISTPGTISSASSNDDLRLGTNISLSPSPNVYSTSSVSPCGSEIPQEIVERYQRALVEDSTSDSESRSSRWTRIRKAFLTRESPHSRSIKTSHSSSQGKDKLEDSPTEEEIRRNYKILQKKLSLEFQEKIGEWERLKQNSPSSPSACGFMDDNRDPFYLKKLEELQKIKSHSPTSKHRRVRMTREYELPADFKKKLQEWEKIKKTSGGSRKRLGEITKWKSLGGPRPTDHSPAFEYPAMSDEFRKKLEEWREIKASGRPLSYAEHKKMKDRTPSPKLSRKNSSTKQKKTKDTSKELHWFEKEIGKIEKEKLRLEREKQKFIDREERLSKLRRSMIGAPAKKEILIHTPSGFHRFEGISRKFTQKLYEWEKSQGIAPEASTFALLSASNYPAEVGASAPKTKSPSAHHSSALPRSKSADSIAISALNLTCPLLSGHPSSLSLNDMEDLEKECMKNSKSSSMQYLISGEDYYLDDADEPEAVLVEVEDYEEETTEPLHIRCVDKHQLPVYQRQEFKSLCESETIVVPKVRRSESARAQINYDLMENIVKLLTELQVTEDEIRCLAENKNILEEQNKKTFKFLNELQNQSVKKLIDGLSKLKEANRAFAKNYRRDENRTHATLEETFENVQDISDEMLQMTDQINKIVLHRTEEDCYSFRGTTFEQIREIRGKIAELRRLLSYICAATDLTIPSKKKLSTTKSETSKTWSNDSRESRGGTSDEVSRKGSEKERRFIKLESGTNLSASQGAVKKRIRYRQKSLKKSMMDSDDEESEPPKNVRQHKKLARARSVSEGAAPPKFDPKLLAPSAKECSTSESRFDSSPTDSAVTLFVKTTRKLFTPIVETSLGKPSAEPKSAPKPPGLTEDPVKEGAVLANAKVEALMTLPPLPPSPVPQRKVYKEVSPSIKLIMAKYNQSLEQSAGVKSGGSSGSNSPIAWRSPVSERRVRVRTEKYQEELQKLSPSLSDRHPVQKSSSASTISASAKQVTVPERKTSLALPSNSFKPDKFDPPKPNLLLDISLANSRGEQSSFSPEIRMRKLQKAKEEFMKTPISAPSYLSEDVLQFPHRNRLSQISVDSESSMDPQSLPGSLIKSASAGMINIEPEVYNRIKPEYRAEGYVSLPRQGKNPKQGKSAFSSIASKFRKVKMRRGKDKDKQAVATLCRQSLVVDISNDNEDNGAGGNGEDRVNHNGDLQRENTPRRDSRDENSGSVSSTVSKSNSWIKRSLFKR